MTKIKIEIKNRFTGKILFEYKKENNTIKDTVLKALKDKTDLREANLCGTDLCGADLREANLCGADLCGADLRGANLRRTNLRRADLRRTNLRRADLRGADLCEADLRGTNLCGANLDFSCLTLSCKSLKLISDEKFRKQIAYHFLSLIENGKDITEKEKLIFSNLKDYANEFHRSDVKKFE